MRRRAFIGMLGGAMSWPLTARAQQPAKVPRIGVLYPGTVTTPGSIGFFEGLRQLGYVEGQNVSFERRYCDWRPERFSAEALELVRLKIDVLVVVTSTPARAVKQAVSAVPIVVAAMADPIGDELVVSLARPGGNVTGTTFIGPELIGKRFGLLRQAIPGVTRVAALWHRSAYGARTRDGMIKETEAAAQLLGLQLHLTPVDSADELDRAFAEMTKERAEAMIALPSPMLYSEHKRIVGLAAASRLPAMYLAREFVEDGGLMSYGANLFDLFRLAATYVDKILKGAKPADLPVEQPTRIELIVNLKAARELGLNLSREFLLLADEVLE